MFRFWRDQRGSFGPLAAISMMIIMLIMAISLNVTGHYATRMKAQNALDAATLSAARSMDDPVFGKAKGKEHFNLLFGEPDVTNVQVDFDYQNGTVTGSMSGRKSMMFANLLPRDHIDMRISSRIAFPAKEAAPPCINALSTSASPGVLFNSGGQLIATECEIHIHSTSNPGYTINSGVNLNVKRVCLKGDRVLDNTPGKKSEGIEKNCDVQADQYAGKFPVPDLTCDADKQGGNYNNSSFTMQPGVYCGWHNFNNSNADVEFEPGLYVIKNGGWNVNGGTWSGEGVTFYFVGSSKIQFNSGVAADMKAPIAGPYTGVFITEDGSSPWRSQFILNDSRLFDFEGIVYLPTREIVFNSGSNMRGRKMNLVADRFIFNGVKLHMKGFGTGGSTSEFAYSEPYISQ